MFVWVCSGGNVPIPAVNRRGLWHDMQIVFHPLCFGYITTAVISQKNLFERERKSRGIKQRHCLRPFTHV